MNQDPKKSPKPEFPGHPETAPNQPEPPFPGDGQQVADPPLLPIID